MTAVVISVAVAFFAVYHRVASGQRASEDYDPATDRQVPELHRAHLEEFRAFLRSLLMHAAVGTALGGVCTLVGEPQNLLIGHEAGWHFVEFLRQVAPVSMPVLAAGLLTCVLLEKSRPLRLWRPVAGGGAPGARRVRRQRKPQTRSAAGRPRCWCRPWRPLVLIVGLALHVAEVGLIGLLVIVLITAFTGVTDEHQIGRAFQEALPFTALLVVFFAVVAVIHQQHLFTPIIQAVLALPAERQPGMLFIANGLLSAISDNVFVATIYITEVKQALDAGHMSREHFDTLAVAINTGTNLPSVATPNGQAAFLFLLTSSIAPLVRLSYGRMVWMALPYTLVMGGLGWWAVSHWL
ncbi:sodium:proton antiporter [Pseudomonas aeruginosa]|nr:sodium:proton antiporter [Pseudomonas aeruginosa]